MKPLTILIIPILILNCTTQNGKNKIELERVITKAGTAESFPGLSNIFFQEPEQDFIYPNEWENPEVAELSKGEDFNTVYVLRYETEKGKTKYYVDTNGNFDFTDEDSLTFVRQGERAIADVPVTIKPTTPDMESIRVHFQIMEKGKWTYGLISEYRKGNITINGKTYAIILRPRYRNTPFYTLTPGTTFLIDTNSDGEYTRQWELTDTNEILSSEQVDITQPFRINGETYRVATIDIEGKILTIHKSEIEEAPVIGFQAPEFVATDLEGKTQKLTNYLDELVLLEFWSTTCPFCEQLRPELNSVVNQYESDLKLVVMARESVKNKIENHLKKYPKKGNFLLHSDEAWEKYNPIMATPTFYLIDESGTIKIKTSGENTIDVIKSKLEEIISKS